MYVQLAAASVHKDMGPTDGQRTWMMVRLSAECVVRCPLELIHSHAKRLHDPGEESQWRIGYLTAHLHHLQKFLVIWCQQLILSVAVTRLAMLHNDMHEILSQIEAAMKDWTCWCHSQHTSKSPWNTFLDRETPVKCGGPCLARVARVP